MIKDDFAWRHKCEACGWNSIGNICDNCSHPHTISVIVRPVWRIEEDVKIFDHWEYYERKPFQF